VLAVVAAAACAAGADNDAREQLARRLNALAIPRLEARAREVSAIQSRGAAEQRQQKVRAKLLDMIGGLPSERSPLNAKSSGTLERDGFRIEKIVFESLPGFYVTANVYMPAAGAGPFPAVVMTPGHSPTGKAGEYILAANLARNGIAEFSSGRTQARPGGPDRPRGRDSARRSSPVDETCLERLITAADRSA